jgi:hypothetical protein
LCNNLKSNENENSKKKAVMKCVSEEKGERASKLSVRKEKKASQAKASAADS